MSKYAREIWTLRVRSAWLTLELLTFVALLVAGVRHHWLGDFARAALDYSLAALMMATARATTEVRRR